MATRYVRSTDGDNADDGSTWALAKATLAGVDAIDTAGDTIWVSQAHSENTAGAVTIALAGSAASPSRVLCGNDAAEPPTALATTAVVAVNTGTNVITLSGYQYWYGITFQCLSSASASGVYMQGTGNRMILESCNFDMAGNTSNTSLIGVGSTANEAGQYVEWRNCGVKFGAAGQAVTLRGALFHWNGGSVLSGSTTPNYIFTSSGAKSGVAVITGVDFSNCSAGVNLSAMATGACKVVFRDCKLPAGWSGGLHSGTMVWGARAEMHNCNAGDVNYGYWSETQLGSIKHFTNAVRTGGATDGTTQISWVMAAGANAEYPMMSLDSEEIAVWHDTPGSLTATVHIIHDSATNLQDDDVWLDVTYLGTSGFPLGTVASGMVSVVGTPADHAASTETWTGSTVAGMTNPNKQKLVKTFTTAEKGFVLIRVRLALASKTIYVCPKVTVA